MNLYTVYIYINENFYYIIYIYTIYKKVKKNNFHCFKNKKI